MFSPMFWKKKSFWQRFTCKDKTNEIFAHIDSQFDDEDLLNLVKSEGNSRGLNVKDSSSEVLPPASVQTTLKVSNKSIPGN